MSTKLEDIAEKAVQDGVFSGAVFHASDASGRFTYSKAFGKTSVDSDAQDMTVDTIFQLASCTKLLTTIAALQMVEQGKVAFEDDVSGIIPEMAKQGILTGFDDKGEPMIQQRKNPIKLRNLLTHTAGFLYDGFDPRMMRYRKQQGRQPGQGATLEERMQHSIGYEPDTAWTYSTSIDWLGRVVERLSGLNLDEYMRQNIWQPLGIENLTFWPDKKPGMKEKLAKISTRNASGRVETHKGRFLNDGSTDAFGGHGTFGSGAEYIKVLHSILADDEKLLKKETTALMFRPWLSELSKESLNKTIANPQIVSFFPGEYPADIEYDWGYGGLLSQKELPGWRGKNTLIWSGLPNHYWFIDRDADLCGIFCTHVLPAGDRKVAKVITAFEKAMHERSKPSKL
ncbi:hypothetical protein MBLNU457_4727t1 [Dothideomycetes sp. NU457]